MSINHHAALSHTSDATDFSFVAFLRELDHRNARDAVGELHRRRVRKLTRTLIAASN